MDRLTERDEYGNADITALSDIMPEIYSGLSFSDTNALTDALNRLAEYEDTGLTPAEINGLSCSDRRGVNSKPTKGDAIRNMTDRELAVWLNEEQINAYSAGKSGCEFLTGKKNIEFYTGYFGSPEGEDY